MTFYTEPELAELLDDGESHRVERKRLSSNRSAIRRNICAFADDLPGVIFIGIEDDGRCAGIEVGDELLTTLASLRAESSIQPLPSMTVDKVTIKGCDLAVVQVEPSPSLPVRYEGRIWIKTEPTVQLASAAGGEQHELPMPRGHGKPQSR